jgi:hypothetical protein
MDKNMPKVRGFARAAMVIPCQFGPRGVDELFSNDKELGKSLLGTLEQEIFVSGGQKDQLFGSKRGFSAQPTHLIAAPSGQCSDAQVSAKRRELLKEAAKDFSKQCINNY